MVNIVARYLVATSYAGHFTFVWLSRQHLALMF